MSQNNFWNKIPLYDERKAACKNSIKCRFRLHILRNVQRGWCFELRTAEADGNDSLSTFAVWWAISNRNRCWVESVLRDLCHLAAYTIISCENLCTHFISGTKSSELWGPSKGQFKYHVIKEVGKWGQKMAIFDDLQYCRSSKRWVGGPTDKKVYLLRSKFQMIIA